MVGFALAAQAEGQVICIGNYFSAKDRKGLSEALQQIMVEAVALVAPTGRILVKTVNGQANDKFRLTLCTAGKQRATSPGFPQNEEPSRFGLRKAARTFS